MTISSSSRNRFFAVLVLTLRLTGCMGLGKDDGASFAVYATESGCRDVGSFEQTLHPYVQKQCAQCHGASQFPLFATKDSQQAFDSIQPYVSILSKKESDGHCGANCSGDGLAISNVIEQWDAAAGKTCDKQPGEETLPTEKPKATVFTAEVSFPANLPNTSFTTLSIDLGSLGYTDGSQLLIDIQELVGGDAYHINDLRIDSKTEWIEVLGVYPYINGQWDPKDSGWIGINTLLPPNEAQVISKSSIVTARKSDSDRLSFGFSIFTRDFKKCRQLPLFISNVIPVMNNRCIGCHSGGNGLATSRFFMPGGVDSFEAWCAATLKRADVEIPLNSFLITYPFFRGGSQGGNGTGKHPDTMTPQSEWNPTWLQWISSEN